MTILEESAARPATAPTAAARLVAATKTYGDGDAAVRALDAVDVAFGRGEFTAVMGPSGSGKSTMMHCAAGLDRLSSGQAFIGDRELSAMRDRELTLLRRSEIGFIFQAFNLVPTLSARANIVLPLAMSGREARADVLESVVDVLGLGDRLSHRPGELSGGQQQRVAVARALVSEPAIVFADEPTGNLDTSAGSEILEFIRRAVDERHQTTVMVTHDPVAAAWADRVVFVVDGCVHGELADPSVGAILDVMRGIGR
ncbi:MAG: ABC transporter ATP-binding protein [Acidimicrobiales bacterium]